jgi:hypothetical protein
MKTKLSGCSERATKARLWVLVFSVDGKIDAAVLKSVDAVNARLSVARNTKPVKPIVEFIQYGDGSEVVVTHSRKVGSPSAMKKVRKSKGRKGVA